jgi:hypothetical protein
MTFEEIRVTLSKLPREQIEELSEWMEEYLEDQLELSDDIKAKLDQSRREIAAGQFKAQTRQPKPK